ncbi:MAG: nuclear transport factor 2 family protein [Gemmatimonadaceae bacterium]
MFTLLGTRPHLARTRTPIVALLLGLAAADAVAQPNSGGSTPEDSVRAVEMARGQALLRADTVALSQMVADEFVEISRLGQVRARADNMREIATGELKLTSVKYDSLAVRIYDDVAVLRGIAENSGTYRGFPFTGRIRYTRVFVHRDDGKSFTSTGSPPAASIPALAAFR